MQRRIAMKGIFGDMFDFDHDGKISDLERMAELDYLEKITRANDRKRPASYELDEDEFEFMDEEERIEAMEEAGLDPDDYDF
jgi:hypothetical protein